MLQTITRIACDFNSACMQIL